MSRAQSAEMGRWVTARLIHSSQHAKKLRASRAEKRGFPRMMLASALGFLKGLYTQAEKKKEKRKSVGARWERHEKEARRLRKGITW